MMPNKAGTFDLSDETGFPIGQFYDREEAEYAIGAANERVRLREALRDLVECSPCQNGCAPDDMTCATMKARAVLNDEEGDQSD